jgi:hypothetical protein
VTRDGFDNPVVTAPGQAPEAKWAEREALDNALDLITGKIAHEPEPADAGGAAVKPGQIVHVRGFKKGEHRAHVVLAVLPSGRGVLVAYCATDRWQTPKAYSMEFIITELQDNVHVRRARRWIEREPFDADGWRRIGVGPLYNTVEYRLNHKDMP